MSCPTTPDCGVAIPTSVCPTVTTTTCPAPTCTPSSYICGDWTITTNADCSQTRTRTGNSMVNGTYTNATVTVQDGCVTQVTAGTNVLQSRPEPCSTTTGSVTPAPDVTLSPAPCNLLSGTSTALYAGVTWNQAGQNITVTGCGTAVSPFVASFSAGTGLMSFASSNLTFSNISGAVTANTSGVNTTSCGYSIVDGQVRAWVDPIKSIIAGRGIAVSTTTCDATVSSTNSSRVITAVSCGSSFVDPATGSLPVNGTWESISAVVTGARLHIHSAFAANVYDSSGALIGSAPSVTTYGSNALALAAMDTIYSASGTAVC